MEKISLPWDLVEEILSRVPSKSVTRFRSASKQWNDLLVSNKFAKKHSANAPKESVIIMLIHSRVHLMRINLDGIQDNVAPSVKVGAQLYLKDPLSSSSHQVDIRKVCHCDGLLLCATKENRLVIWNPCSGETKWIQPRDSYKRTDFYALGYESNSSCKKYKILRVDVQSIIPTIRNEYEMYDFTSDSWRVLGVATDWLIRRSGRTAKGNTYWAAVYDAIEGRAYCLDLQSYVPSLAQFQQCALLGGRKRKTSERWPFFFFFFLYLRGDMFIPICRFL
ncbi:putative F-box protein At3g21130 [Eutrema salsugineum]|uniref:putative F-box protein At3g21130 n=1 Tax=Eutrema salsugineum TaxID=72664 RepID=UPI000CED7C2B|nr:putative F-box protein At3g21130 [Eutrema salsugineum]